MTIQNEAVASFTGIGRRQVIEETTWWRIPWPTNVDPLAQTFTLTEDRFITAVGLYFGRKSSTKTVTIQIRNVVNGYPGATVMVSKTLLPAEVNASEDGSAETKVTFDEPVLLFADTEYAIVAVTDSDQYCLYVARMAENDLISGTKVTRQPYTIGVLFSSSNATAWTAHQEMDMKFKLYGAVFENEAILQFDSVTTNEVGQLIVAAGQLVPRGCNLLWQWSPDGALWFPLANGDATLLRSLQTSVYVRAILRKGFKTSPVIQAKTAILVGLSYKDSGVYVSKQVTAPEFSNILVYLDMYVPSGTSQVLQYSVDDGDNWVTLDSPTSKRVDANFYQYRYTATLDNPATTIRLRINSSSTSALITPKSKRLILIVS